MNLFDDLSPKDIRYFLTVVEEENLARAAERLGLSQTTLTRSIQRVEDSLKLTLFQRSARGMKPNETALDFAKSAQIILQQWETLASFARSKTETSGLYTLGCHDTVGINTLPKILSQVLRDFDHLEISIETNVSRNIQAAISNQKLDFGIIVNPVDSNELVIRKIGTDVFTLWEGLANKNLTQETHQDFHEIDLLYYEPDLFQSAILLESLRLKKIQIKRAIKVKSLEVIAALAEEGAYALLPKRVAQRYSGLQIPKWLQVKELSAGAKSKSMPEQNSLSISDEYCLVYKQANLKNEGFKRLARELESRLLSQLNS
jgi:LysR family transcriptional regulator, cell division regulator